MDFPATGIGAFAEVDFLLTFATDVFATEFVRKDFYLLAAMLAGTNEGFQVSELFKTGTMAAWCIHAHFLLKKCDILKKRT